MDELPLNIKRSISRYQPIETEGLTLHPYRVENYYEYLAARRSLEFMQQSLPIHLMNIPLLEAYFRIDCGLEPEVQPEGLFASALLSLSLALRLMPHGTMEEQVRMFRLVVDKEDQTKLKSLRFIKDGEEVVTITPVMFQRLRPIIAAQNGIELESETANPELIQAERDLTDIKAPKLDVSVESLVNATALVTGRDESEVYQWAILKMNNRLSSAKKILDYMICGIGEAQGTKWNGGNPNPNPWFNRLREKKAGLMAIEDFAGGQGVTAIQNQNNKEYIKP